MDLNKVVALTAHHAPTVTSYKGTLYSSQGVYAHLQVPWHFECLRDGLSNLSSKQVRNELRSRDTFYSVYMHSVCIQWSGVVQFGVEVDQHSACTEPVTSLLLLLQKLFLPDWFRNCLGRACLSVRPSPTHSTSTNNKAISMPNKQLWGQYWQVLNDPDWQAACNSPRIRWSLHS
jgi:hypothetical protein